MIKLICDFCGGEIIDPNYQTCLNFNSFGVSKGPVQEYQLHADCAKILQKKIESMMKLGTNKPEED